MTELELIRVFLSYRREFGGASRDRTDDLIVANDALSQLSYSPTRRLDCGSVLFYQSCKTRTKRRRCTVC
jgi:hypothetical protein